MVTIVDYTHMFENAEKVHYTFLTGYGLVKQNEIDGKVIDDTVRIIIEGWIYDAFKIHPDVRNTFLGLEDKLCEMHEMGYLEFKEGDLSPFDAVTKDKYYAKLFS
ncbi:MAG: hypothetical protein GQ477_06010 [Nanohaloarchaea archaeon]|nr:hypothetical protein [Candidatus Nanohaloarchaea archaeon]